MGYAETFLTERPQDGLDAVQARLRRGKALHEQFANYFKERAHIEDMYAKNISKAFQKHFVTDTQALGTFTAPWEKLNAETVELATLHGQLSLRITNEVERPLRDFAKTNSEWQNLSLAETNCNRIAKEFDEKQVKVAKYTKAVERVSGKKAEAAEQKLIDYTKQLESTRTAWRLEGPVILQKYQAVDQSRLDNLKQVVSAFEAIQTEVMLQIVEMSSRTSTSTSEFDPIMDIELFASEISINMHTLEPHDGTSVVSATSHLGNGDTIGSVEPRRSNGTHTRGLTGGSQMSNVSYSTDRSVAQSKATSIDQARAVDTQQEHMRSGSTVLGSAVDVPTNHVDSEGFSIPPPDQGPWSDGGMSSTYDDERSETSSFSQAPKMQMEIKQDLVSESNDEARAALERVTSTLKQTKTVSRRHPGRREVRSMYQSEDSLSGFNSYQSSPLSTTFSADSTTPSSVSSPGSRGLFNTSASHIQTSTAFSPAPSRANTLGVPSASSPVQSHFGSTIPPTPPLTLTNGASSGSTVAPGSISTGHQHLAAETESLHTAGTSAPTSPITVTSPNGGLLAPGGLDQKRTWVVSVIEKVHVATQAGEISKMLVTGEVILAQEGAEFDPDLPKKALLRLDHLQALEKCIPNQVYLSAKEAAEGAYWVDLEALSRAMQQSGLGLGQGVVVLKYQVRTTQEETRHAMIPLLVHPAWKCEPHQTSLLINYKANVNCKLSQQLGLSSSATEDGSHATPQNAQLSELSFLVPVSGEVVNVQSRPTGIWNSDSNKMFWDVDNVEMSSTTPEPRKLLARFELNPSGGPSNPSPTAVKFRVQGRLLSDLMVRLEKECEGEQEQEQESVAFGSVRLQVQSGRYLATA
ncbi:Muniscin C-terminal mu homology domain-containing protein [Gamsiella multidivaricata]|uniref:Muniscin C-terminal mu homology domain-containing protein n=1 Tax=Gamsiella multidivaricata TaxID=101098 RepID=UPI0022205203|nr:Muniscin C-terminal mu homology domain-containing protein [Gamsiella multidivaricata]KAI7822710.1 Muniscin C-terminal mu homology domain-containing protein [Gamsiella multidivaricata]